MMNLNSKNILIAIFISPFLGVFLGNYLMFITFIHEVPLEHWLNIFSDRIISSLATGLIGLILSFPSMLIIGLPTYYFLKKKKLMNVWLYSLCGAVGGFTASYIALLLKNMNIESVNNTINLYFAIHYSLCGFFSALIFWFIVEYLPNRKIAKQ